MPACVPKHWNTLIFLVIFGVVAVGCVHGWGVAVVVAVAIVVAVALAVARAVARAARRPLVGCTTAQANRLLAASCSAPNSLKAPGQGGLEMLTAMAWKEDNGNRGPRGLRGD